MFFEGSPKIAPSSTPSEDFFLIRKNTNMEIRKTVELKVSRFKL